METCKGKRCPLLNKQCLEHACAFYQQLLGVDPSTGEQLSAWDCAFRLQNVIMLENTQQQRETGASIQALRNETSQRTLQGVGQVLQAVAERRLEEKR